MPILQKRIHNQRKFFFKPFCSERCRSLDLSNWLNEKNVISSNLDPEDNYN